MSDPEIFLVRPHRRGWQCVEAPGVEPYWIGEDARRYAISYALSRTAHRFGEIRVIDAAGRNRGDDPLRPAGAEIMKASHFLVPEVGSSRKRRRLLDICSRLTIRTRTPWTFDQATLLNGQNATVTTCRNAC